MDDKTFSELVESVKEGARLLKKIDLSKFTQECLMTLRACQENRDTEIAHGDADAAIIKFLSDVGFSDIAYEFSQVHKWYS